MSVTIAEPCSTTSRFVVDSKRSRSGSRRKFSILYVVVVLLLLLLLFAALLSLVVLVVFVSGYWWLLSYLLLIILVGLFRRMWTDNGDHVSITYAGTGALKRDVTLTGKFRLFFLSENN